MKGKRKKRSKNSILRAVFVAVSIFFQAVWLMIQILKLNEYSVWIALMTSLLSAFVVLQLYSRHTTAAMKMPWIMLILAFPVMGLSLYLMIVVFGDFGKTGKQLKTAQRKTEGLLSQSEEAINELERQDRSAANISRYAQKFARSPVYWNTAVRYYAQGAEAFEAMKQELEKAERFIFMEYFIVAEGSAFRELRDILERKAAQGVDVRLMYDDIGSIGYANFRFASELNKSGIRCQVFNPALPVLNLFMNHRDHRKITVIDGKVGFTGGYNLADEYFDRAHPYGKWKDTGLRLEGEAVRSLTAEFLKMWYVTTRQEEEWDRFLSVTHSVPGEMGFVQPFGDDPLDRERVAENVYLNLISRAKEKLYITTPYLIITDEMNSALGLAAKRGVDVRIITPGIPDKKTVFKLTQSYYPDLVEQGVRIFEYTPGFIHAKQCLCDGDMASIGTSNLDYRSLYLHFENNVLLYNCAAVKQIEADFESLFPQCREVTDSYRIGKRKLLYTWQCVLRLFAPLM